MTIALAYRLEPGFDLTTGETFIEAVSVDPFEPVHVEIAADGDLGAARTRLGRRLQAMQVAAGLAAA